MKQERTPIQYTPLEKDGYLKVSVSGYYSLSEVKKMYTHALEIIIEKELSKIFFDSFAVHGRITTTERFYMGEFAAMEAIKFRNKGLENFTVAFYGKEPIIDPARFGELVAKNRGLKIKVTTDIDEALQFLEIQNNL